MLSLVAVLDRRQKSQYNRKTKIWRANEEKDVEAGELLMCNRLPHQEVQQLIMDFINKYGLNADSTHNHYERIKAVAERIQRDVIGDKNVLMRHDQLRPEYVVLASISQKDQECELLHRISIDFGRKLISIAFSFLETEGVYSLKARAHRNMACRYALNYNAKSKDIQLKINPLTGDVIFNYTTLLVETPEEIERNIPQIIMDLLDRLKFRAREVKIGLEEFFVFEKALQDKKSYPETPISLPLDRLTKYVPLSNKFTWMQLFPSKKVENVFKKSEQEFKNSFVGKAKGSQKRFLWEIFPAKSLPEFAYIITKEEEETINPILRSAVDNIKKDEQLKIINEKIDLSNQTNFSEEGRSGYYARVSLSKGQMPVLLRFDLVDDINQLKREKNILKKLRDNDAVPGLPTYYAFDKMEDLVNYRITNLTPNSQTYSTFLKKNKETLSITTKLDILKQIITTMVQLKTRSALVNKIAPVSIRIEQGLQTKIFDLSRGYCHSNQQLGKVSTESSEYLLPLQEGDEREDSYSFGVLMYRTVFGATPLNPNPRLRENRQNPKRYILPVLAIEKFEAFGPRQMLRMLAMLSLKCTDLKKTDPNKDRQESSLRPVPYMDWLCIIVHAMHKIVQ